MSRTSRGRVIVDLLPATLNTPTREVTLQVTHHKNILTVGRLDKQNETVFCANTAISGSDTRVPERRRHVVRTYAGGYFVDDFLEIIRPRRHGT
jgi:hypothetical protein